jgi:hypothetical protein
MNFPAVPWREIYHEGEREIYREVKEVEKVFARSMKRLFISSLFFLLFRLCG